MTWEKFNFEWSLFSHSSGIKLKWPPLKINTGQVIFKSFIMSLIEKSKSLLWLRLLYIFPFIHHPSSSASWKIILPGQFCKQITPTEQFCAVTKKYVITSLITPERSILSFRVSFLKKNCLIFGFCKTESFRPLPFKDKIIY